MNVLFSSGKRKKGEQEQEVDVGIEKACYEKERRSCYNSVLDPDLKFLVLPDPD
jgi:hypothetical protein